MHLTTKLLTIGILFGSFAVGFLFYYIMDANAKHIKKQRLDELLTVIIQFIIYLWLAKVVLQLPRIIEDPLAILAYPSNATHFYIASGLLFIHVAYKKSKGKIEIGSLFHTFSFVMIVSLFLYKFLQVITNDFVQIDFYFISLMILVLGNVIAYKGEKSKLSISIFGIWLILASIFSIKDGYFILFGFMLQPAYFIILTILLLFFAYKGFGK